MCRPHTIKHNRRFLARIASAIGKTNTRAFTNTAEMVEELLYNLDRVGIEVKDKGCTKRKEVT